MALFCAACPQPRINLLEGWKYARNITYNGNFSAEQLKPKNPWDDVNLTNGDGFMVREAPYQEHLKVAAEIKEVYSIPLLFLC